MLTNMLKYSIQLIRHQKQIHFFTLRSKKLPNAQIVYSFLKSIFNYKDYFPPTKGRFSFSDNKRMQNISAHRKQRKQKIRISMRMNFQFMTMSLYYLWLRPCGCCG